MKVFYLLSIVCLVRAGPVDFVHVNKNEVMNTASPRFFENVIEELLESVREIILNGNEDIPVLDPFVIDHLDLDDETIPLPGARVTINDGTVKNLGTFIIDHLRTTTVVLVTVIELEVHIPVIEVTADEYDLFLPVMDLTIFGKGDFNIQLVEPRVDINLRYAVLSGVSADVKVSLGSFEPQINGLFYDQAASDFVNLVLKLLVEDLLVEYEDDINTFLSDLVGEILADVLPGLIPYRGIINNLGLNTYAVNYEK
ncbi:uncharacterized protein LOC113522760 [Galleria mellonella]|uniref:Uncharacterized protein LOC113522760 n=1 Tax=Galleria mellonella TaxID=7137 RepID=A0A6J1X8Z8_GALME|nr:uncharacterized protein LOC113522760 [Galleria mellonella]